MLTRMHPVTRTLGMIKSEFKNIKFALRLSFYDLDKSPISRNCDSCVRRKNGKKIWHFTTVLRQTKTWLNRLCKSFTQNAFLSTAIFSTGTGSFDEKVLATMSSTERQRQVRLPNPNFILLCFSVWAWLYNQNNAVSDYLLLSPIGFTEKLSFVYHHLFIFSCEVFLFQKQPIMYRL